MSSADDHKDRKPPARRAEGTVVPRGWPRLQCNEPSMVPADVLDRYYRRALAWTAAYWACLCLGVWFLSPADSFRPPASAGASAALGSASLIMAASVVTRLFSLITRAMIPAEPVGSEGGGGRDAEEGGISGAVLVGLFAQASSAIMNGMMAFYATPMFVDPVTGMDVYLLRWCEWAPLCFIMALLTASIDADSSEEKSVERSHRFALFQGLSTTLGLTLPLMKSVPLWWATFAVAILLHGKMHPLLVNKTLKTLTLTDAPLVTEDTDRQYRIQVAGHLTQLLTVSWSLLVVQYVTAWIFHFSPTTVAILECSVDVISKHFYLNYLLDAHRLVFGRRGRSDLPGAATKLSARAAAAATPDSTPEQRVILFTREGHGAAVLMPADVAPGRRLLDAARRAQAVNKTVFEKPAGEGWEWVFKAKLRDGTDVPFTLAQSRSRTLSDMFSIRGIEDALTLEVVAVSVLKSSGSSMEKAAL